MELLESLKEHSLTALCWWAGFCAAFFVLTRLFPCNPGRNWWNDPRAALTDFIYWLVLMPVTGLLGRIGLLWVGVLTFYGTDAAPDFVARSWPLWTQCVIILLVQDALMYWTHRLFHTRRGWAFHAVHHSPETLDWTAAARFHPVNEIGQFALADAVVLLLGFSPLALVTLAPVHMIYSVLVHANLNWTFGPLRYILASPVFHRWHHTSERDGLDKNFAPTFPFFDLLWGTFYMPAGRRPETYGANEPAMPAGPVGQTLFPFRGAGRWARRHPVPATACVLASAALGYFSWQYIGRPMEPKAVATQQPDLRDSAPDLLPLPPSSAEPKQTDAVAASAVTFRVIYGRRDGSVAIRDVSTGRESSFAHHTARVNSLASSPNGKLAASASSDGTARVFDTETGAVCRVLPHAGVAVRCVAVSDDGWVATGTVAGVLGLWNPQGQPVKRRNLAPVAINAIAISEGGGHVIAGQGTQVMDWCSAIDSLTSHRGLRDLAFCVTISRDGRRVAAGGYDGHLHLWDHGREQSALDVEGHAGPIYSVSLSPGGDRIATGGADQVARVWNADSGVMLNEFRGPAAMIFAVSYDERHRRVLAAGKDRALSHWDLPGEGVVPASGLQPANPNH
jgi:sterol desaturase/sphingolipid hydroxylase (fatty acid hydroxylase superfamily)